MKLLPYKIIAKVKGIFTDPIQYRPLLENGDSESFFGNYEGQRYGNYDTSDCWCFSGAEILETRLEMLEKLGLIPQETIDWAQANGYKDADGDWYISRRWIAILSNVRDQGNYQLNFWGLASVLGVIPNAMLPYSQQQAYQKVSRNDFNNDYYNGGVITPEMQALGKEFLKRFKIQAENISGGFMKNIDVSLKTYLKEGSLQIGIPVPQDGTWNKQNIDYPTKRYNADHAVELYKYDPTQKYPFYIYDSYEPHLKQLSSDYYIPIITRVAITPILPTVQAPIVTPVSNWSMFWSNVSAWLQKLPIPYPNVPIGGSKL